MFGRIVELEESDEPDIADNGRFGVKGIVRGSFVGPGVCDMAGAIEVLRSVAGSWLRLWSTRPGYETT